MAAEMLYWELTKSGKGSFNFNGSNYQDQIHIYSYGNKLYMSEDIAKSALRS
jgi:hypothetical protein